MDERLSARDGYDGRTALIDRAQGVLDDAGQEVASSLGQRARYVHLDVREQENWTAVVAEVERHFGPLSVLVNNAAILGTGGVEDATPEDFLHVVAVNQLGCLLGMQAAARSMRFWARRPAPPCWYSCCC